MTQTPNIPFRSRSNPSGEAKRGLETTSENDYELIHRINPNNNRFGLSDEILSVEPPLEMDLADRDSFEDAEDDENIDDAFEQHLTDTVNQTNSESVNTIQHSPPAGGTSNNALSNQTSSNVETADEMSLRLSNEFAPIHEIGWDTVVYIGPPPQQHHQTSDEYEYIKQRFSRPYLLKSQTLRNSGSSEFEKRLGPMSARVSRKLKNLGVHQVLPNDSTPKYWVDLRPMQNDDEALLTVAELTCSPGVLGWHKEAHNLGVDHMIVGGKDSLNTPLSPFRSSGEVKLPPNFFSNIPGAANLQNGPKESSTSNATEELEPDYSPIRHHTAIERLLHALAGNSPRLNSAPKVWNFFAVAKIFDCATHPNICNEIYSWIFAGYNAHFVAAEPEVCYKIALGTQNKMLLRVSFCILVGERTLAQVMQHEKAQNPGTQSPGQSQVMVGRPLSHLDDDELNRIDHAAQSLSRRVMKIFDDLINKPTLWMQKSSELFKLFALAGDDSQAKQELKETCQALYQLASSDIIVAMTQCLKNKANRHSLLTDTGESPIFSEQAVERYNQLPLPQRLFSQILWSFMKDFSIYRDTSMLHPKSYELWNGFEHLNSSIDPKETRNFRIRLEGYVVSINKLIRERRVHYHSVNEQSNHNADYEIRWDAVYSAALRNFSLLTENKEMSPEEKDLVVETLLKEEASIRNEVEMYNKVRTTRTEDPWGFKVDKTEVKPSADSYYTSATVNCHDLLSQLSHNLGLLISRELLRPGYLEGAVGLESDIPVNKIDTLLCLNDEEFKFLPLWADGNDDGTGGVFTDVVPGAIDEDFKGGKRGLGVDDEGLDGLADVEMGEGFSVIDAEEAVSTVAGASKVATAGAGTDSVMSLDE